MLCLIRGMINTQLLSYRFEVYTENLNWKTLFGAYSGISLSRYIDIEFQHPNKLLHFINFSQLKYACIFIHS